MATPGVWTSARPTLAKSAPLTIRAQESLLECLQTRELESRSSSTRFVSTMPVLVSFEVRRCHFASDSRLGPVLRGPRRSCPPIDAVGLGHNQLYLLRSFHFHSWTRTNF